MRLPPARCIPAAAILALTALAGCNRTPAPGAESAGGAASTVGAAPAMPTASGPMPVSPLGLTNSSSASQAGDRTNSTAAAGTTSLAQPASSDNPPAGGTPASSAGNPASSANQALTSQAVGVNPGQPPSTGADTTSTVEASRGPGSRPQSGGLPR